MQNISVIHDFGNILAQIIFHRFFFYIFLGKCCNSLEPLQLWMLQRTSKSKTTSELIDGRQFKE